MTEHLVDQLISALDANLAQHTTMPPMSASVTEVLRTLFGPLGSLAIQAQMIDPHWYLRGDDD